MLSHPFFDPQPSNIHTLKLNDIIQWPLTLERKGLINNVKMLYAKTSNTYKKIELEKQQKKMQIVEDKERKKIESEEKIFF